MDDNETYLETIRTWHFENVFSLISVKIECCLMGGKTV